MSLELSVFLQLFLYLILRVKELVFGDMYGKTSILLLIPIILIQAITIKFMYIYILLIWIILSIVMFLILSIKHILPTDKEEIILMLNSQLTLLILIGWVKIFFFQ